MALALAASWTLWSGIADAYILFLLFTFLLFDGIFIHAHSAHLASWLGYLSWLVILLPFHLASFVDTFFFMAHYIVDAIPCFQEQVILYSIVWRILQTGHHGLVSACWLHLQIELIHFDWISRNFCFDVNFWNSWLNRWIIVLIW